MPAVSGPSGRPGPQQEMEQFASAAAHELRSALNVVAGYCHLLRDCSPDRCDDEMREFIEEIVAGVDRASRVVDDLLSYSRVGRDESAPQPVNLEEALRQARQNLAAPIAAQQAAIVSDPLPTVPGNAAQLIQLFQHLLDNAIKFCGKPQATIRITAQRQGGEFCFGVRDNGLGIAAADSERVFRMFERLHGHHYPGSGMGLPICRRIVERHGGRIWLQSNPEGGSTFFFTLPAGD